MHDTRVSIYQPMQNYQSCPFKFPVDNNLLYYLTNLQGTLGEDDLYSLSVKRQPLACNSNALLADDCTAQTASEPIHSQSPGGTISRSMSYHGSGTSSKLQDMTSEDEASDNSARQTSSTSFTEPTSDGSEEELLTPRTEVARKFHSLAGSRDDMSPTMSGSVESNDVPSLEDYQLLEDSSGLPPFVSAKDILPATFSPRIHGVLLPNRRYPGSLSLPRLESSDAIAPPISSSSSRRRRRKKHNSLLGSPTQASEEELDAYDIADSNDFDVVDDASDLDGQSPRSAGNSYRSSHRRRPHSPRQSKHRFEDSSGALTRKQELVTRSGRSCSLGGDVPLYDVQRPLSPLNSAAATSVRASKRASEGSTTTTTSSTAASSKPSNLTVDVTASSDSTSSTTATATPTTPTSLTVPTVDDDPTSPRGYKSLASAIRSTSDSLRQNIRMRDLRAILSPRVMFGSADSPVSPPAPLPMTLVPTTRSSDPDVSSDSTAQVEASSSSTCPTADQLSPRGVDA
jgi:hypothetical protein